MRRNAQIAIGLILSAVLLLTGCGSVKQPDVIRVGSLKGPTTIGMLQLMEKERTAKEQQYEFTMAVSADELTGRLMTGDLDIALIPANVAAILFWQSGGGIRILDINTLGVLYMVSADTSIQSFEDLKGRRICMTGKGTGPDVVLQYLLSENGISKEEVELKYCSEATEVAQLLTEDPMAIGVLPQPFVTVACGQNEALRIVFDLTRQWEKTREDGSSLVTGVTIASREFVQKHPERVKQFLKEHAASASYVNANPEEAATWAVEQGIIAKEAIAKLAIPRCNVTCLTGQEMKKALTAYYQVLYEADPALIGKPTQAPTNEAWNELYYGVTDEEK